MPRPRFHARHDGFTLIEILFALGLIALLASILLLGAGVLVTGSKEKATKVTLTALKGMLSEFDSKTRLNKSPKFWLWHMPGGTTTARTIATGDFWIIPARDPGSTPTPNMPMPLDAPGLLVKGNYDDTDMSATSKEEVARNGSRQVLNTQLAMGLILQMPANRDALAKLPPESYFVPRWVMGSGANNLLTPGSDGVLYAPNPSRDDGTEAVWYPQGAKVQTKDGSFLCISPTTGMWQSTAAPTAGTDWVADRSPATPILLDAWGNPIIFVPGTGLRVRKLNGEPTYNDLKVITAIDISPEGKVDSTNPLIPIVVLPGRPFFASAGPDGDFAKGDDNIYSFEQ